jgi:hypothetical protein
MSSFNYFKKKVYNNELSIWKRLAALRSCIKKLSDIEGINYPRLLQSYNEKYNFDRYINIKSDPPSEEILIEVFEQVEKDRNNIIASRKRLDSRMNKD